MGLIESTLRAGISKITSDIESRDKNSLDFSVHTPVNEPELLRLADILNQYSTEVGEYVASEATRQQRRADELMQAYNALQSQTEEINRELSMARRIQQRLLPQEQELPDREEIRCFGYYSSMSNVGGDIYDVIRVGRNSYAVLIADVSGHGIPAALITSLVKISFRTKLHWGVDTAEVCTQVNEDLFPILNDLDYYATAFLAILDLESGVLRYTNCGHHPGVVLGNGEYATIDTRGKFLGAFENATYETQSRMLAGGDSLFLYTDGISEARNLIDEEYGMERLSKALRHAADLDPQELIRSVFRDLDSFCMSADPRDDRTMIAVKFYKKAQPT